MEPIEKFLKEKNIPYKLIQLEQVAYTVDEVIAYAKGDIRPEEICKTIILKGKKTGQKAAVLLLGNERIDFSKAKKVFNEEMCVADREEVKIVSGVDAGAVCPFLLTIPLFVDEKALALEKINCGSGNHLYGLEFKTVDFSHGVSYKVISIGKSN